MHFKKQSDLGHNDKTPCSTTNYLRSYPLISGHFSCFLILVFYMCWLIKYIVFFLLELLFSTETLCVSLTKTYYF